MEVGREQVDELEDGAEPTELGREIHEWATAVKASDARAPIEKPIQSGVQTARVEDSRSSKEREVVEKLGKGVRNEEGVRESSVAKRSGRESGGLHDRRSHGKQMGMRVESKRDSAELRGDGEPSNRAIR